MAATTKLKTADPTLARNRQASHEYSILETFEAGIELAGTEVKALRDGRTNLREGYVRVENGEAWLLGVNIAEYTQGHRRNHEPQRRRRLLLHKREIGLARGKKLWDKRQAIAERDARRDVERATARARRLG